MYAYQCEQCGSTYDRIVALAKRDEQRCGASVKILIDGDEIGEATCDGLLSREEISETAKMGMNWQFTNSNPIKSGSKP